jgi:hypothetical protein
MIIKLPRRDRLGVFLVCLGLSIPALAVGPSAVDENAQALDQTIQALKQEVLDIDSRSQSVEQDLLYPPYSRVNVYVGVAVKGLLLKSVTVSIDDGTPVTYQYSDEEAKALQEGTPASLHRLTRTNAAPGPHRLKADFTARVFDSKAVAPLLSGHYEAFFDKDQKPSELELTVEQNGFRADPTLRLHDWRVAR